MYIFESQEEILYEFIGLNILATIHHKFTYFYYF